MDEFTESQDGPRPGDNLPEMTVSELSGALKRTIEDAYGFVRVRGELGRVVVAKSGHVYFDIKDANATLNSVMWKGQAARLPFRPEEGLEVVAEGKLSTYPGRSNYQLIAERMRPAGLGALMQLLEERKKKLAAEGLFAPERKRALPFLPSVIGVVTSPTGAVIRDILHRVRDRYPCRVIIWPALVQGERAAAEVEAGIRGFNAMQPGGPIPRPDVIIVARGGGSIEDLWPFNEERVVRAAADSEIPLISAVGHETDTTLIDYASDKRAPTPTGAAEMALPVKADLVAQVSDLGARTGRCLTRVLDKRRLEYRSTSARFPKLEMLLQGPRQRLDIASQRFGGALGRAVTRKRALFDRASGGLRPAALRREIGAGRQSLARLSDRLRPALSRGVSQHQRGLDALAARLQPIVARRLEQARRKLETQARVLGSLSYEGVLKRGFALVTGADGALVRSIGQVKDGDALKLRFADGEVAARAGAGQGDAPSSPPPPPKPAGKKGTAEAPAPDPAPRPRIHMRKRGGSDDTGDLF